MEVEAPQPEVDLPAAAAAAASSSSSSSSKHTPPSSTANPIVSSSGALPLKRPRADTEEEDDEEDASSELLRPTKKPRSKEGSSSNEGRKRPHQEDESEGDDGSVTADGFNDGSEGSTRPAKRMRHTLPTSVSSEGQADNEELSEDEKLSEDESEGPWVARASSARPFVFDLARLEAEGATEEQQGENEENSEEEGGEPQRAFSAPPFVFDPARLESVEVSSDELEIHQGKTFGQIQQELAEDFKDAALVNFSPADDQAEALVYQYQYTEWQVTWQRPEHLETATTKETGPQFNLDNIQSWSAITYPENENKLVTFSIVIDGLAWEVTRYNPDHIGDEPGRPIHEQEFDSDSGDQPPVHFRQAGYGNQVNSFGRPPYRGTFGSDTEDDN